MQMMRRVRISFTVAGLSGYSRALLHASRIKNVANMQLFMLSICPVAWISKFYGAQKAISNFNIPPLQLAVVHSQSYTMSVYIGGILGDTKLVA